VAGAAARSGAAAGSPSVAARTGDTIAARRAAARKAAEQGEDS